MLLLFRQKQPKPFVIRKTRQLFATKKMIAETFTFKLPFASDSCG